MKKLSFLLAVLAMLCLTVSAAAAGTDSQSKDVTAKYESTTEIPDVYSVDIEWSSVDFVYDETVTKNWNTDDHTYETVTEGAWDKTTATVTVTNHSNMDVTVDVAYAPVEETGVTGTVTNSTGTLAAGVEGKPDEAAALTATLTISGEPTDAVTEDGVKIGAITVTINK